MTAKLPRWIPLHEAVEIEGSASTRTFHLWAERWNSRVETVNKVRRRHGKVELNSLLAALAEDEERFGKSGQMVSQFARNLALNRMPSGAARGARRA